MSGLNLLSVMQIYKNISNYKKYTGILKNAIEELKRKESLGNMIIVNKYGKIVEISKSDAEIGLHRLLLKGFF